MSPKSTLKEINDLNIFLLENQLAISTNPAISRRNSEHITLVTWASAPSNLFEKQVRAFATVYEYRTVVEHGMYHAMLFDGSILQMNYRFLHTVGGSFELIGHRLCFYPCPFSFSRSDLEDIRLGADFLTVFDLYLEQEIGQLADALQGQGVDTLWPTRLKLSTPLRFEFDPSSASDEHSPSHLHLLHKDFRWPVFGPLSTGHFAKLIFRRFYPSLWTEYPFLRELESQSYSRCIRESEIADLYIDCAG